MAEEWYEQGLRFGCTQCGNCCTGPEGAVWFTEEEGRQEGLKEGIEIGDNLYRYYVILF